MMRPPLNPIDIRVVLCRLSDDLLEQIATELVHEPCSAPVLKLVGDEMYRRMKRPPAIMGGIVRRITSQHN